MCDGCDGRTGPSARHINARSVSRTTVECRLRTRIDCRTVQDSMLCFKLFIDKGRKAYHTMRPFSRRTNKAKVTRNAVHHCATSCLGVYIRCSDSCTADGFVQSSFKIIHSADVQRSSTQFLPMYQYMSWPVPLQHHSATDDGSNTGQQTVASVQNTGSVGGRGPSSR